MQELGIIKSIKEIGNLFKENPILIVITLVAMVIGTILGAVAFYNEWLG